MEQPGAWTGVAQAGMKEPNILADASVTQAAATDFESVVHQHARLVFKVAYSVLRNVEDAEDVVQETFLRAFKSGDLPEIREVKAWLARIAWRCAIDRTHKAPVTALEELSETGFEPVDKRERAEATVIADEKVQLLHKLMATLPDDLRETLVLSTVEEMSSVEIAKALGIPETSVRTRLFRARQLLKEKLASLMEGDHGK